MIFKPQSNHSGLYVNNVTLRSNRSLNLNLNRNLNSSSYANRCGSNRCLGHKVTKACSSIKASQVELFMAFYDYGVEIILRLKTRQEYLWIFWFLGYSSSFSVLRIRRWLLVNHVSPLASVSAEGLPATNRNLFIFQVSLHCVLELYIMWATALIWCMIYALFLAWPPCCLVE